MESDGKTCRLKSDEIKCNCGTDLNVFCDADENDCKCKVRYKMSDKTSADNDYHCIPNCEYFRKKFPLSCIITWIAEGVLLK